MPTSQHTRGQECTTILIKCTKPKVGLRVCRKDLVLAVTLLASLDLVNQCYRNIRIKAQPGDKSDIVAFNCSEKAIMALSYSTHTVI